MFELQLVISFFVGGLLISLQSLIAERVSSDWKGIVLTVPTTMAIGFLFTGLVTSPQDIYEIAVAVPITLSITYVFVALMGLLSRFGLVLSLFVSSLVWFLGAYTVLQLPSFDLESSLFVFGVVILLSYFVLKLDKTEVELQSFPMTFWNIGLRALFAGLVVVGVVYFSKTLGNIWGALMAVFPASMSSTVVIYFVMQDKRTIPSVARSMFFPGSIGFVLYALVAAFSFGPLGIWWGTLVSYIAVFVFFVGWKLIRRCRRS